ncbi:MAG: hypothetical protein EPN43_00750 [Jatrophihabitans sp.]|nr:MAG: hypothetical protein EPN43_00750 [Jatrophihabitans sp.]
MPYSAPPRPRQRRVRGLVPEGLTMGLRRAVLRWLTQDQPGYGSLAPPDTEDSPAAPRPVYSLPPEPVYGLPPELLTGPGTPDDTGPSATDDAVPSATDNAGPSATDDAGPVAGDPAGSDAVPRPRPSADPAPPPVPELVDRGDVAGGAVRPGLVVAPGQARMADLALPSFYAAPEPAAASPTAPYGEAGLLRRYDSYDRATLREAWEVVQERVDALMSTFYGEVFLRLPEAMFMFPSDMRRQRNDFARALLQWVVADEPEAMRGHLDQLGADHRKFDVEPRHYEIVGAALVSAWRTTAGAAWTSAHEAAILGSYTRLASMMLDGAMRRLHEPASWGANVVGHERILSDFAVVRIQPDKPYPYKAGQYLTLEVPSHRREWRQMSIASAPRADNSFDIHVRAVGAAGVSSALVRHTRVGARLKLGPPRGHDLVVEPGTVPSGLLCIGSGTGAAPIAAVVESVLGWNEPPARLHAYVGGRSREDIYAADALTSIVRVRGRSPACVQAVVSEDPEYSGLHGRVESLVPTLADWAGLGVDVLVAGPDAMIAATLENLTRVGVTREKIHFDQYEIAA